MLKKSSGSSAQRERMVLECRVNLKKLQRRHQLILEREISMARSLKNEGRENASINMKIKINYYMVQMIKKTLERLDNIEDTAELSKTMNEFAEVLGKVNMLAGKAEQLNVGQLNRNMRKMAKTSAKEEKKMASVFQGMEKQADADILKAEGFAEIENGVCKKSEAVDIQETEEAPGVDLNMEMAEIDAFIKELVNDL